MLNLTTFPDDMSTAIRNVRAVRASLIAIRDQSGDLPISQLESTASLMRKLSVSIAAVVEEIESNPTKTADMEAYMQQFAGFESIQALYLSVSGVQTAAAAWNDAQNVTLQSLQQTHFMGVVDRDGVSTRHPMSITFIPAAVADPLRASDELANLIASFDASPPPAG